MTRISKSMAIDLPENIPIDYLQEAFLSDLDIRLGILRLDTLHTEISGNKWFKLRENLQQAKENGYNTLLTFGGAYSNHLAATAVAAALYGFKAIAVVRGWHGKTQSSPTLDFCSRQGMYLHFVSKEEYSLKYDEGYLQQLRAKFDGPYLIPEGGNNEAGRKGCGQIAGYIPGDATDVAVAIGTGTTFCGIRNLLPGVVSLHGFPVMKNGDYLSEDITKQVHANTNNWTLHSQYHFGGFARQTSELIDFINIFYQRHSIMLDFVYTAKLLFALFDLIQKNRFRQHAHIIAIHTGGLQGNASIREKLLF